MLAIWWVLIPPYVSRLPWGSIQPAVRSDWLTADCGRTSRSYGPRQLPAICCWVSTLEISCSAPISCTEHTSSKSATAMGRIWLTRRRRLHKAKVALLERERNMLLMVLPELEWVNTFRNGLRVGILVPASYGCSVRCPPDPPRRRNGLFLETRPRRYPGPGRGRARCYH